MAKKKRCILIAEDKYDEELINPAVYESGATSEIIGDCESAKKFVKGIQKYRKQYKYRIYELK